MEDLIKAQLVTLYSHGKGIEEFKEILDSISENDEKELYFKLNTTDSMLEILLAIGEKEEKEYLIEEMEKLLKKLKNLC